MSLAWQLEDIFKMPPLLARLLIAIVIFIFSSIAKRFIAEQFHFVADSSSLGFRRWCLRSSQDTL